MFKANWEKTDIAKVPTPEIIDKMVTLAFPRNELSSYEIIEGGCANINIKLHISNHETPYILRIYVRDKSASYREQKLSQLLKSKVPVPCVRFIGDVENYRFAIVDYLPGVSLRELLLSSSSASIIYGLMVDVGNILSKISSFKFSKAGFFDENMNIIVNNSENTDLKTYIRKSLNNGNVIKILGKKIIIEVKDIFTMHDHLLLDLKERHLVHGDFDAANILVHEINGNYQVSGILDWEFAFSGSNLWDVANMLRYSHKMPGEFKDAFIKGLSNDEMILPNNWEIIIRLLNIISLVDCLKKVDIDKKLNQCSDIVSLIENILADLKGNENYLDI